MSRGTFTEGRDVELFLSIYPELASCQAVPTMREGLDTSVPVPAPSPRTWVAAAFERACLDSFPI